MNEFIKYILQFGNLNQQQIDFISGKTKELDLPKDEYFAKSGKFIQHTGFLVDGIIRLCHYDDKGEGNTIYFINAYHLILNWKNLDLNDIDSLYLQAVTDCKLMVFSKRNWKEISDTITNWDYIIQKIDLRNHAEKHERKSLLVSQDATTRYLEFIEKFPQVTNRVPLSYVASYLGITPSSLSRIRKNIN